MAHSADVLASTLQDLAPKYSELFLKGIPLFSYIIGKQSTSEGTSGGLNKYKLKGPWHEFAVVKGGPGAMSTIQDGSELIRSTRRQQAVRGKEYPAFLAYHYQVPAKDLMLLGGPQDFVRIAESYPQYALADAKSIVSRQLARGASSAGSDPVSNGANGIFTLNGSQSYSPEGTSRTGLFQWAAKASQTGTVHDLPLHSAATNPTTGWYHQYDNITSFGADGMKRYRTMVSTSNQEGLQLEGKGVDLVCCDLATYQNMLEAVGETIQTIDNASYPLAEHLNRDGFKVGPVDWYWDPDIDITDTTAFTNANAQLGVAYVLNTSHFEVIFRSNEQVGGNGFFDMREHVLIPDQLAYQYRILSMFNVVCKSLRHQGVLTGGAQE